jgi:hypothetical protein
MQLSDKAYNILKRLAMVWIPAVGTLYGALAATVGVPNAAVVIGVLTAVDAFLGVMLGVSTSMYQAKPLDVAGIITAIPTAPGQVPRYVVNFTKGFDEIEKLAVAHFHVQHVVAQQSTPAPPGSPAPVPLDNPGR